MADNVAITAGSGTTVWTDEVTGSKHAQVVKLADGTADSATVIAAGNGVAAGSLRVTLASDSTGVIATKDAGVNWTPSFGVSSACVTSADATGKAAVTDAPASGQKIVVTDIIASSDTALFLLFEEETSATLIFKVFLPANGVVQITPRGKVKLPVADKKLMVDASAAGNIAVTCCYYSEA